MKIVIIGPATSSTSSPAITICAASAAVRVRQWTSFAEATCDAAGRRLRRTVSYRRALKHRLEEFFLELLAAIALIAIFIIVVEEQP